MKKRASLLMAMLAVAVSLTACGDSKSTDEADVISEEGSITVAEEEETGESETEESEVVPDGMYRSELTNELIDESLKDQRPVAVMVDNESIALPHYGLSKADVVYEMMNSTENGRITRLMVLVKDWESIEQLGSIRSVRPTNVILSAEWNAVLVHDGGPFYIDEYLAEPSTDNFSGGFSRVNNGKSREYTEYVLAGDLESRFASSNVSETYNEYYPGEHYQFVSEANERDLSDVSSAVTASKVELPFPHNGSYLEYSEEDKVYNYFEYGKAHVDPGNDNAQLCFKNLLIQDVDFEELDENGYMIYNVIGSGDGYYVTNGKAEKITWKKTSMTDQTRYYDADGNELKINTGKTYVALVPSDDWSELVIE